MTTVFKGHNFDLNEEGTRVHHNLLERTGTKSDIYNKHRGSIDVETRYGDIKNVTIEDNVFVAPFDTGVTDHLNPNGGILNHVEIRNNQTMGQLSHPAQAGVSAPTSKPVGQRFIPLPDDGITSNGLRRMEILDTIPGFFACC